ncbi:lipocalin family protein [Lentiprolixibacter aurantiacus]|uniref:Lipocalin family protein n=1 Tax=Lentiprolixibacter aurantiacus TaxID=2993939 RepID=A0AAE3ML04_9FLAO|nr:lipocalin family protein [Lentiprolixibacter aurantiacus]MCX2719651.1 lipocalin family protein [Lentiprolixibacter aurantiacus]
MKSKALFYLAIFFALSACSVTKSVRSQRNLISGTWSLENIKYENNTGTFNAVLFNDATAVCFEGSDWFFRDNNSTGRYTIKSGSLCDGGDRFIRWSVVERPENYKSQLQFKFIDEKFKDLDSGLGYRLEISSLTEGEMILRSNVSVDGSPITIVYEFVKK